MEEIPLSLIFKYGMMGSPSYTRSEDHAMIGEWSIGVVTCSIAEQMTVASGI